jgi:hypothetical protein
MSHGSRGFSISGLPGLTQRGTRHFLPNAHVAGRSSRFALNRIHDITDDEMSHQNFLNAYLVSNGADPVDMEPFRTLQGSTATGSSGKLRLTNLMQLTINLSTVCLL